MVLFLVLGACTFMSQSPKKDIGKELYSLNVSEFGSVSILAVNMDNDSVIAELNANQRMTPASLTKIFTTGACLASIENDYRYKTKFYVDNNNLCVVGGGDPTLGSSRFESTKPDAIFAKVLQALKQKNIKHLNSIIVDNSCYSGIQQPSKRLWEDMGNYYGAVPNGLSYRENTFFLSMQSPEKLGEQCRIIDVKPHQNINIKCLVKSANNNKDSAYIYGNTYLKDWYVSGTIPKNRKSFTIKGAMPEPEVTFADELKAYLNTHGFQIETIQKKQLSCADEKHFYTHKSPLITDIIDVVNKKSHNLYADHLLFSLAEHNRLNADWDNGAKSLSSFWENEVSDFTGTFFDGSGLSPFNAFSASDMVAALKCLNVTDNSDYFKQSLSVAGIDGTLRSIFKEKKYKGRFIGKSGSMNGVLGYSGYLTTQSGEEVAVCIIVNRFTESYKELRGKIELLLKEISDKN